MPGGRPLKFKSAKKIKEKAEEYFNLCDKEERPYGIVGLAVYLETTRETLIDYQGRKEFSDTIKELKQRCQASVEKLMLSGKAQAGAIFWMKNHGWHDKQQLEVNDISELSEEQLKAKLASLLSR